MLTSPGPQDVIIIGVGGDLGRRKLIPALYNLGVANLLPEQGKIIGVARRDWDDERFRQVARDSVAEFSRRPIDEGHWQQFAGRLSVVQATDGGYQRLKALITQPARLIYLAVPPASVSDIICELEASGLVEGTRLILEKPFGEDLESSSDLANTLHRSFAETQVFRIDHYLGKETVQNVLVFRFGNAVFERVWNRDAIDHVQMTVAESIGVEGRGAFYEQTGAVRDIVQNHALQMLSLLTMEPPATLAAEAIRDEKAKVLLAMRELDPARSVRGQYGAGEVAGQPVAGYRQEPGVSPDSRVETYFAAQLEIDTWRWSGVPFYLRTGKRLPGRTTEVTVAFRAAPLTLFSDVDVSPFRGNRLIIRIQPDDGISFRFMAKQPGADVSVQEVEMDFNYRDSFMTEPAEAYERLLHDALDGDQTLFARQDSIDHAWRVVEPVLGCEDEPALYAAGSWGPREAADLIAPRHWFLR